MLFSLFTAFTHRLLLLFVLKLLLIVTLLQDVNVFSILDQVDPEVFDVFAFLFEVFFVQELQQKTNLVNLSKRISVEVCLTNILNTISVKSQTTSSIKHMMYTILWLINTFDRFLILLICFLTKWDLL